VHVHGGERSGTVDEPVRHAISKLSSYHLVATADARERLLRMGEEAGRIHVVGAPGLDGLQQLAAAARARPGAALALPRRQRFVLALFHPVVQQAQAAFEQTQALQQALVRVGLPVLWLDPNADAGSRAILEALDAGRLARGIARASRHLPRARVRAAMRHCAVMVGNSSAGIIEAASFGTPVRERRRPPAAARARPQRAGRAGGSRRHRARLRRSSATAAGHVTIPGATASAGERIAATAREPAAGRRPARKDQHLLTCRRSSLPTLVILGAGGHGRVVADAALARPLGARGRHRPQPGALPGRTVAAGVRCLPLEEALRCAGAVHVAIGSAEATRARGRLLA
jgi:hypothetical protein